MMCFGTKSVKTKCKWELELTTTNMYLSNVVLFPALQRVGKFLILDFAFSCTINLLYDYGRSWHMLSEEICSQVS